MRIGKTRTRPTFTATGCLVTIIVSIALSALCLIGAGLNLYTQ